MQGIIIKRWIGQICRDEVYFGLKTKSGIEPTWLEWIHRNEGSTHCDECLKLDGCWFLEGKVPLYPHHPSCHCVLQEIPYSIVLDNAKATAAYSKFDPYLFDPENFYHHGKQKMFTSWGYSITDSKWLQAEIERQGLEKYIKGEYELGLLNGYGQRINIQVIIPKRTNGENASFITGWMVKPNGTIQLNTPYAGE